MRSEQANHILYCLDADAPQHTFSKNAKSSSAEVRGCKYKPVLNLLISVSHVTAVTRSRPNLVRDKINKKTIHPHILSRGEISTSWSSSWAAACRTVRRISTLLLGGDCLVKQRHAATCHLRAPHSSTFPHNHQTTTLTRTASRNAFNSSILSC